VRRIFAFACEEDREAWSQEGIFGKPLLMVELNRLELVGTACHIY
jgi:hypothetical protein